MAWPGVSDSTRKAPRRAPPAILGAMACTSAAVLLLQFAASRFLSATVGYHAAFAVIALVMLAFAASATTVFVRGRRGEPIGLGVAATMLTRGAVVAGLGTLAFVWIGALPVTAASVRQAIVAAIVFGATFWFAGWAIAFLLADYHADVGRVYWVDLSGAAVGCLAAVAVLDVVSPMDAMLLCGVLLASAGAAVAWAAPGRSPRGATVVAAGLAVLLAASIAAPALLRLRTAKGADQSLVVWERWNHLARVSVSPTIPAIQQAVDLLRARDPARDPWPIVNRWRMGWGMSDTYDGPAPETLWIRLDADAGTQIIRHGADAADADLAFLAADVTSTAHHLLRGRLRDVYVIGGGGGRDVLAALYFGAERVRVAELNPDVVAVVDGAFGAYSGRPYSHPKVRLTVGEARSELSRIDDTFDLIQMSMVDTWAASMAGSMVLTENVLYTEEAFRQYLAHLKPDGMLTVSRWYHPERHGELARLIVLTASALRRIGVEDPAAHMVVVYATGTRELRVGTVVAKRNPFTEAERGALSAWSNQMGFHRLWPRDLALADGIDVAGLVAGDSTVLRASTFDLLPPTDDRPFFFNVQRPFASWADAARSGDFGRGSKSTLILGGLLAVLALLSGAIVVSPLARYEALRPAQERTRLRNHARPVIYFAGIGLGFMWVELALIQRYILFLGHPTFALSVVLFALLLFGGIGSAMSARLSEWRLTIMSLIAGIGITAWVVPMITAAAYGWNRPARIVLAAILISPLGVAMGTMYPKGVRALEQAGLTDLIPWAWAINGVAGVIALVVGMFAAMEFGYTVVLMLAGCAYVATLWASRRPFAGFRPGGGAPSGSSG